MGIMDFFRRRRNVARGPRADGEQVYTGDLTDPRIAEFIRSGGMETSSGAVVSAQSGLKVATAFRCVNIISGTIATLPLDLKRREGNKRRDADDHSLWKVLRKRPNAWQTPSEFRRLLQLHVLQKGNGYARIIRGARGRILALRPLDPDCVEVRQNPDDTLTYTYSKGGKTATFPQEDMLHLRGLSLDGVRGLSVLSFARESIGLSIQSERHAASLFKNGLSANTVLEHPKGLDDPTFDRIKAQLDQYRGAENNGQTLLLEDGMKLSRVEMSAVDKQFIQNREITQLEVAMFYGVPPHMLGLTQKTTSWGSGIEQQGIGFVTYNLADWTTMWEQAIDRACLSDDDPALYVKFNFGGLVRGDIKTRYAAYAVGRQWGWLSANDVRAMEDQDPIEDGDTYLTPANMLPAGDPAAALIDKGGLPEDEDNDQ